MAGGSGFEPRRILLVLDDCGAGDALKVSWLLRSVREALPAAQLTLLVSEQARHVYERTTLVDRVVVSALYRRRSASLLAVRLAKALELIRLALAIGRGYDVVITFWWGSTLLHLLGRWAGRGPRIGYARRLPGVLTSHLGAYDFRGDEVEQNARLIREAGIAVAPAATPEPLLPEPDATMARALLERHGLADNLALVILHPGSDWACQMWAKDRWAALGDELVGRGAALMFTGTAAEAPHIDAIRSRMRAPTASAAGETTITGLAALLARARLCVCVDSGTYVVAQAVGVPTVVLAGPSSPERLVSRSQPPEIINRTSDRLKVAIVSCKEPRYPAGGCLDHSCPMAGLRDVTVADVLAAVDRTGALATCDNGPAKLDCQTPIPGSVRFAACPPSR